MHSECHVKTEAEATEHQGKPRLTRNHQKVRQGHGTDPPSEPPKEPTLSHIDFGLLDPRAASE